MQSLLNRVKGGKPEESKGISSAAVKWSEQERKLFFGCWATVLIAANPLYSLEDNPRRTTVLTSWLVASAEALSLDPTITEAYIPLLTADSIPPSDVKQQLAELRAKIEPYRDVLAQPVQQLCHMWIHLLVTVPAGYDARLRVALKVFVVMLYLMEHSKGVEGLEEATHSFLALEQCIAHYLLLFLEQQQKKKQEMLQAAQKRDSSSKLLRQLKIGGAAVAAGGLFAITGGLAAPGIAAGIAVVAGGTAIGATAAALFASSLVVTALFGIGGGTLAAYKMQRRTGGLTEFEIQSEAVTSESHLSSVVAISGWLLEDSDVQRPWGVVPSNPPIRDKVQLLERFYSVYCPEQLPNVQQHLELYKDREGELWAWLESIYGRNPDAPFPRPGQSTRVKASREQEQMVRNTFAGLGLLSFKDIKEEKAEENVPEKTIAFPIEATMQDESHDYKPPKHVSTVWDYYDVYGGAELLTVKFESKALKQLCDSAGRAVSTVIKTEGTKQALKYTVMATLMTAVALPSLLLKVANMIDEEWTVMCERADEAGVELARALLYHKGGNRPMTLVGYSFGARIIYACVRELVRYQKLWEEWQEKQVETKQEKSTDDKNTRSDSDDFSSMRDPSSILEDVIFMGLPKAFRAHDWERFRSVVAGRLINCFSQKDMMLGLMFRYKRLNVEGVCGTGPVSLSGIEDIDVSDLVSGHSEYCYSIRDILNRIRFAQPFHSASTKFSKVEDEILTNAIDETNTLAKESGRA
ncbi:hypothetical protein FisN_29Lh109 [Fistulifera solaris]|uniref:Transmembrane and coiled-coil domain-containing protein 4 n=1 Tax=Fistulifera solaris TaxID=1519565 RepID=A0A1Z5JLJ9_FISSO|nr:hypothetical protein FisN_29Lh109 [Fistulifera solaris]|eukprot:GAX14893.1 hypothetical protein FisN_29Lh109 [Fistulifera solaris]